VAAKAQAQKASFNPSTESPEPKGPDQTPVNPVSESVRSEANLAEDGDRSVTVQVEFIEYSVAEKMKQAIASVCEVRSVRLDYQRSPFRKAKFSIRTSLTSELLACILAKGVGRIKFSIVTMNEKTIRMSLKTQP